MISKRAAIVAMFAGCWAKLANADDPAWKPMTGGSTLTLWSGPSMWTVNLDAMVGINARMGGKEVTLTAAEIFEALSGGGAP